MAITLGSPYATPDTNLAVDARNDGPTDIWMTAYFYLILGYTYKIFVGATTDVVPPNPVPQPAKAFRVVSGPLPQLSIWITIHVDGLWLANTTSTETTFIC